MEDLMKLCSFEGISGFEFEIGNKVCNMLRQNCDFVDTDVLGNVVGVIGKGRGKKIMIEAHLDEIGLMVKNIDDKGFISFVKIGGINPATLPAAEVFIHGKEKVFGVIGSKPPHLQTEEESKKNYKIDEMYIDTGFSREELLGKIQIGDAITFVSKPVRLQNEKMASKSIDNRMGIWCLIECAKRLKGKDLPYELVFLAAVQEEVGLRGAKVASYSINPDAAIVIDVTHGISPYTESSSNAFPLGCGVAVGVGPNLHPSLSKALIDTAKKHEIPHVIEVCAGNSGTDAWAIQITKKGIPCALVSVPLRYMHTQVETVCMSDIEAVASTICSTIEEGMEC